jgi:hypothetical protein
MILVILAAAYIVCLVLAIAHGGLGVLLLFSIPLFAGIVLFTFWIVSLAVESWLTGRKFKVQARGKVAHRIGQSPIYNDVPETRGTARNKGTYAMPTMRDLDDALRLAAFRAQVAKDEAE